MDFTAQNFKKFLGSVALNVDLCTGFHPDRPGNVHRMDMSLVTRLSILWPCEICECESNILKELAW
jgi:hypothetical protein